LIRFAAGADILVSEAYVPDRGPSVSQGERPWSIQDYHMSAREAGETAEKAKVKILVLTHLIPGNAPEKSFSDEAAKAFRGKIIVGRDLMRIVAPDDPVKKDDR
jgi:ribonuclease BN (tRNA processing enzyme)